MKTTWISLAIVAWTCNLPPGSGIEYCLTESFHARCDWNEVVLMRSAKFGRMELGRCVTRNFGSVGCSADVLAQLDFACSGRQACDLSVSDPLLVRTKPCPLDFTSYLDATFECVPAINSYREECEDGGRLRVTTSSGYITSFWGRRATALGGGGGGGPLGYEPFTTTPSSPLSYLDAPLPCPVEFNLDPGQRINITLLDFALSNRTTALEPGRGGGGGGTAFHQAPPEVDLEKRCDKYGVVQEPMTGNDVTVCGGGTTGRREKFVFASRSSLVLLKLTSSTLARFLLKFEISGCASPLLPHDVHLKYQVDRLIARCNKTGESFVLFCDGQRWKGDFRNCSSSTSSSSSSSKGGSLESRNEEHNDLLGLPHIGMSIAIILGVAMVTVVYVGIIMVCALHIRRWRKHFNRPAKPETDFSSMATSNLLQSYVDRSPKRFKQKVIGSDSGNEFSEFFELQQTTENRYTGPSYKTCGRGFYVDEPADSGDFCTSCDLGVHCPDSAKVLGVPGGTQSAARCCRPLRTDGCLTMAERKTKLKDTKSWSLLSQPSLCGASLDAGTEKCVENII